MLNAAGEACSYLQVLVLGFLHQEFLLPQELPTFHPSTTHQRPINDPSTTHQRPINDPSTTHQRPINAKNAQQYCARTLSGDPIPWTLGLHHRSFAQHGRPCDRLQVGFQNADLVCFQVSISNKRRYYLRNSYRQKCRNISSMGAQ